MDFQQLFSRILQTVDEAAYFTPVEHVDAAQRAAVDAVREAMARADFQPDAVRGLIERLATRGHLDPVMRLSALHVVACHPAVADYEEAARLVGEQEFAALQLGGPNLQANLASVDRHRGVLAFVKGHHEVALDYFARALERQRTAENVGNVLCTLCAMGEIEEARALFAQVREGFPGPLVTQLEASISQDPDLAPLRSEVHRDLH